MSKASASPPPRRKRRQVSAEQLASLSHEFRTPLNGVLGMTRLLEGTGLTAEQRAYVAALKESGEHLLGLVNDVLDFARLGAGKLEMRLAPLEVEDILRSVCELLSPRAQEKGLAVAWSAPAGLGRIHADEGRIRQILLNFAGNAVKFTQVGGVHISAGLRPNGQVRFSVEDTGPGVDEAARVKIFEAFAQAEHGPQFGGAGLGLAIARSLAHAMDGEVGVENTRGGGAVFWFEAPFERTPSRSRPAGARRCWPATGRRSESSPSAATSCCSITPSSSATARFAAWTAARPSCCWTCRSASISPTIATPASPDTC
jgi:signal transduction histidine kinase